DPGAVAALNDRVRLIAVGVASMKHTRIELLAVDAQVAHDKGLEQLTGEGKVACERIRADTPGRHRERRVRKVAPGRLAQRGTGSEMLGPCRGRFRHHE